MKINEFWLVTMLTFIAFFSSGQIEVHKTDFCMDVNYGTIHIVMWTLF